MMSSKFPTWFLLRDGLIVTIVVIAWVLWWPVSAGAGPLADFAGVMLGIGGAAVAFVCHEWGHLLGAIASGGRYTLPPGLASPFLFSFDSRRNSQRQFVIMSLAGFAVTGAALVVVYWCLPADALATRVVRGAVLFLASLTVFLEVPLLVLSLVTGSILQQAEVFPVEEP